MAKVWPHMQQPLVALCFVKPMLARILRLSGMNKEILA